MITPGIFPLLALYLNLFSFLSLRIGLCLTCYESELPEKLFLIVIKSKHILGKTLLPLAIFFFGYQASALASMTRHQGAAHHMDSTMETHSTGEAMESKPMVDCRSNDFCPLKSAGGHLVDQCHGNNENESGKTYFLSCDCGGGDHAKDAPEPSSRDLISCSINFGKIPFSLYFLPPQKEASLAGFPGKVENPPETSLL